MRKIVHLSDIHFGKADKAVAGRAVEKINELSPHVVVVSGDLTQRARSSEFIAAKKFLDQLPQPQIVVPGNHDIPLYNVFDRFFRPLHKFQKYVTADLTATYFDDELAIVGVNTARSFVVKGGRINHEQIAFIQSKLCALDDKLLKIVVTHHPFDLPANSHHTDVVGRAEKAMPLISQCGGDVFLAGHLHVGHIETTAKRYKLENGRVALVIQAGTATSIRVRGESQSFNLIEFEHPRLRVERLECKSPDTGFLLAEHKLYEQSERGWEHIEAVAMA
ncbi:MAG: metallophosphoesterase [Pyrinomonadaceae bacterium]